MMLIFVVVIGGLLLLPGHILYLRGIYKRGKMEEEKRGIAFGFFQLQLKNNLEEVVFSSSAERTLLFTNIISLPRRFSVYFPRLPSYWSLDLFGKLFLWRVWSPPSRRFLDILSSHQRIQHHQHPRGVEHVVGFNYNLINLLAEGNYLLL